MLETAILGLLVDADLHGYELKKRLTELLGPWSSVSFGSLYPALTRLERTGLVRSVDTTTAPVALTGSLGAEVAAFRARSRQSPSGRRGRKVYAVTDQGRARLADLLDDPGGDDRAFAVRVAFCRHLPPARRLALFRRREADLAARLAEVRTDDRADRYRRSLAEFQHDRLLREHDWLRRLLDEETDAPSDGTTSDGDPALNPTHPGGVPT